MLDTEIVRNTSRLYSGVKSESFKMMKFLHKFNDSIIKGGVLSSSSTLRVSSYSSERSPNLYDRLVKCNQERISLIPVLDEWVAEVGYIRQQTLELFIRKFTERRRFTPALHVRIVCACV